MNVTCNYSVFTKDLICSQVKIITPVFFSSLNKIQVDSDLLFDWSSCLQSHATEQGVETCFKYLLLIFLWNAVFVLKQEILFTGCEEALLAFAAKTTKTVHIYQPKTNDTVSGTLQTS